MGKTLNTLNNALHKRQGKGKKDLNQLQTIFQYLFEHIATASMVSDTTGIYQKNICRFKKGFGKGW